MISLMTALLLAAAADPTPGAGQAASPPPAAAAPAAKKPPDPDERVCWSEQPTGSHLTKEICATRAQRDLMAQRAKDDLTRNNRSGPGSFSPH